MSPLLRVATVSGLLAVAAPAHAIIVVGHPVPLNVASGSGLTFTSFELPVSDQEVEYCVGSPVTYAVDEVLGLSDLIGLPTGGAICGVELYLSGPVVIEGTGNSGGTFTFTLNMQSVHVRINPSITVTQSGTTYTSAADAITLGDVDWVTATWLDLGPGIHRDIALGDSGYYSLRDAVRDDSHVTQ